MRKVGFEFGKSNCETICGAVTVVDKEQSTAESASVTFAARVAVALELAIGDCDATCADPHAVKTRTDVQALASA